MPRITFVTGALSGDHDIIVTLSDASPTFAHGHSARTDEGWSSVHETFTLTDDGVMLESYTDGRDCDGRMSTHGEAFCPFDKLSAIVPWEYRDNPDAAPFRYPEWQELSRGQRDYSAEAAGY